MPKNVSLIITVVVLHSAHFVPFISLYMGGSLSMDLTRREVGAKR